MQSDMMERKKTFIAGKKTQNIRHTCSFASRRMINQCDGIGELVFYALAAPLALFPNESLEIRKSSSS